MLQQVNTHKKAFKIREEFLAAHPNLNPVLRSKLLQATDDLDRINNLDDNKDNQTYTY